jgi:hypothetical protein
MPEAEESRVTATTCAVCGGIHSSYECAVETGVMSLQERFDATDEPLTIRELVSFLMVSEGWPSLIAMDAALRYAAANANWRSPPKVPA